MSSLMWIGGRVREPTLTTKQSSGATTSVTKPTTVQPKAGGTDGAATDLDPDRTDGSVPTAADIVASWLRGWSERLPLARLAQLLAVVPALVMIDVVRRSSDLQAMDYWTIFPKVVDTEGGLQVRELFHFHEGHVLAVPGVVYWLNWKLFDGLNRTLGVFVIGVVATQVVVLRAMLPKPDKIGRWWYALLVVGISVFLFTPQGAHHFGRAMSGTAWLTANLLSLIGIWAAYRQRPLAAIPFAVAATLCYGTGLMAWPAVLVVTFLTARWAWRQWVLLGSAVIALGTYAILYERPTSQASAATDPNDVLHRTAQVLGTIVSEDPGIAVLVGTLGIVSVVCLAAVAFRTRNRFAAPWISLAVYACGGALLIGGARSGVSGDTIGVQSRYAASSALLWSAIAVLLVLLVGSRVWIAVGSVAVILVCYTGGQQALSDVREFAVTQDATAVGIRMGVANGSIYFPYTGPPDQLEHLQHYPFSSQFDLDCGLIGTRVDDADVAELEPGMSGMLDQVPLSSGPYVEPTVELSGWFASLGPELRCVVFADDSGMIVGAAGYGLERTDLLRQVGAPGGDFRRGFVGPAMGPALEYRAYAVVSGSDELYQIPATVPGALSATSDEGASPAG